MPVGRRKTGAANRYPTVLPSMHLPPSFPITGASESPEIYFTVSFSHPFASFHVYDAGSFEGNVANTEERVPIGYVRATDPDRSIGGDSLGTILASVMVEKQDVLPFVPRSIGETQFSSALLLAGEQFNDRSRILSTNRVP